MTTTTITAEKRICVICAWRENCVKRYRLSTGSLFDVNCPDYTRDVKLQSKDVDKLVEDQVDRWRQETKDKPGHVITLSSEAGAGGGRISRILATKLKMNIVGSELIHKVAESAHMSDKVIKTLDEKSISLFDSIIHSFFEARHIWPDEYLRHLSMVLHTTAKHGNVIIIGRGGSFILKGKSFRLRIVAPRETRVEKAMRDRHIEREEAIAYVQTYEADQTGFIKKYFNEDINDPKHYDMIVNTEHVDVENAADSIQKAFLTWQAARK